MNLGTDIYRQTVAPTAEPLTRAEAREHLRLDEGDYDNIIDGLIVAARQYAETFTRRQLVTATWQLAAFDFACGVDALRLLHGPVQAVTAFTYVDTAGDTQTLTTAGYTAVLDPEGAYVVPAYGTTWPSARCHAESVLVTYRTGYGAPTAVPQAIKQAMLLLIGHWFANPEAVNVGNITTKLDFATEALLWPFREMGCP
jgi:uncharacterized phiE125 gp8 family phage protein